MREFKVEGFILSRSAAPPSPETRHPAASRANLRLLFSSSSISWAVRIRIGPSAAPVAGAEDLLDGTSVAKSGKARVKFRWPS